MNEIQNISTRVDALPPELQRQILDFIEFVISKYQRGSEISEEEKAIIDQRIKKMEENPEDNMEWEQARAEIHQRLNWK